METQLVCFSVSDCHCTYLCAVVWAVTTARARTHTPIARRTRGAQFKARRQIVQTKTATTMCRTGSQVSLLRFERYVMRAF